MYQLASKWRQCENIGGGYVGAAKENKAANNNKA
jgi:hypothetical protein